MLRAWGTAASSGGWNRTSGTLVFSEVLYHLSYTGNALEQYLRQESNLACDLRRIACIRHTPEMSLVQYPRLELNQDLHLRRVV